MLVSILILVLALLIIFGGCATEKKAYVTKDSEELYWTWVNPEYNEPLNRSGKSIFYSNGIAEGYLTLSHKLPHWRIRYIITSKWSDRKGNIWYRYTLWYEGLEQKYYKLAKISGSGNTRESVYSGVDHPKKIDKSNLNYGIYSRQ
jgi:hypothetical protein